MNIISLTTGDYRGTDPRYPCSYNGWGWVSAHFNDSISHFIVGIAVIDFGGLMSEMSKSMAETGKIFDAIWLLRCPLKIQHSSRRLAKGQARDRYSLLT
jgi:hypothetical protein